MDAVGAGVDRRVDIAIDEEEGAALEDLVKAHRERDEVRTWHRLLAELDDVHAAVDGCADNVVETAAAEAR